MSVISRGFGGGGGAADPRVPPGQYVTHDVPVLSAGPTPHVGTDDRSLDLTEVDGSRTTVSWEQLMAKPIKQFTVDLHGVTT